MGLMIYKLTVQPVEDIEEVRVLQWHRAEGEAVAVDQLLVELETSKAIVEIRSKKACVLRKIETKAGEWSSCGPAIAWFSDGIDEVLTLDSEVELVADYEIV